jgi:hypothetical protein
MVETGAARWLRWLLLLAFACSPTWVYAAATGLSAALVCFLALACALYLVRWAQEGILRDLAMCGAIAGTALISHLEAAALAIAVAAAVWVIIWADRGGGWAQVEGTLITLLLPALAVAAVWAGVCWAIMGDPLHSLRGGAAADRAWLLALETALCASLLLWCRWAGTRTQPLLAAVLPTLIAGAMGVVVAGWNGAAPSPWAGYGYLQPATQDGRTFSDIRSVAWAATAAAGDGVVLVDSDMAFAVALASGRPSAFVSVDPAQPAKARDELSRATHLLTDRLSAARGAEALDERIRGLLGGRRLEQVFSVGQWRLFRLDRNVE